MIQVTPGSSPPATLDPITGATVVEEPGSTPQSATAAVNTQVQITVNGVAGQRIRITHLSFSYSAVPAGGTLTVVVNAVTIFQLDAAVAGPTPISLPPGGLVCAAGQNAVVTLTAAGAAVVGKLNVGSYLGS